ncbi:MAG: PDZ domain-containing protein, partial [Chloroflexi bacterium]|nr:PDZ domain-containing protein [Chloroflexota bacterium]
GPHALLVTDVTPSGAAEQAGLIPGDILVAVDAAAGDVDALHTALRRLRAGAPVRIELLRGGERRTLEVVAAAA